MRGRSTLCSGGILTAMTKPIQCTAPFCDSVSSIRGLCSYFLRCYFIFYRIYQDFLCQSFVTVLLISFPKRTTYEKQGCSVVSHALIGPEATTILFLFSLLSSSVFRRPVCTMRA